VKRLFKPMEAFVGTHLFVYGLMLIYPAKTFNSSALMFSEPIIGAICLLLSAILIFSVWKDYRKLEVLTLTLVTSLWSFVAAVFLVSFFLTGVLFSEISFLAIGLFTGWLAWKVGGTVCRRK